MLKYAPFLHNLGMNLLHYAQEEYVQSNQHKQGITTGAAHLSIVELANPGMHFDHPFRELFLWAVLMDRSVEICS